MNRSIIAVICGLCLFLNYSCKDNSLRPIMEFSGITETSSAGPDPIGKIDPDDWKPMMDCGSNPQGLLMSVKQTNGYDSSKALSTCTKIYPVYPNPASKSFVITYSLKESNNVLITLNNTPATIAKEIVNSKLNAGTYQVFVDVPDLKPAIYRVYIKVFSQSGILSSYGDVQITE